MSSLFNSSSLRRLSGSPQLLPEGDLQDASVAAPATAPLPYQPRRRTPGGSTSSIPPPLALADGGAAAAAAAAARAGGGPKSTSPTTHIHPLPPGVQVTSPTSSNSTAATPTTTTTNITRLFSNPVTPTTSTTDLSSSASLSASNDTITAALPSSSASSAGAGVSRSGSTAKNATGRLQLTNLKATAQRALGLSNDSLGMKMLEALVQDGSSTAEWRAVVELLLDKKVVLLLPAAPAGTGEVGVGVVRDHLALANLAEDTSKGNVCVLLKSGLVGKLGADSLSFESYLPPDSPIMASLLDPLTRKAALESLVLPPPPLPPSSPSESPSDPAGYPSVTPTLSTLLPFPPPSPTPIVDSTTSPQASSKSNRRASLLPAAPRNPFAGLFGRPRAVSASPAAPTPDAAATGTENKAASLLEAEKASAESVSETPAEVELQTTPPDSRPLSVRSARSRSPSPARSALSPASSAKDFAAALEEDKEKDEKHALLVSALGISTALKPADTFKALGKAWRSRLAEELEENSLPSAIVKSVQRFACLPLPPSGQAKSATAPPSAFKMSAASSSPSTTLTAALPSLHGDPEVLAGGYQEFFGLVHEELEVAYRKEMVRALAAEEETVRDGKREEREREIEQRALAGVDSVEGCLARFHFNYLFSPFNSSDQKHDEVLANRIAALNKLGLTVEHLGVVTTLPNGNRNEEVWHGLEALVKVVGDELRQIQSPQILSTKSKSQILVSAHKMVIEGLRQLPPIRLRPEGEEMPPSTPATEPPSASATPEVVDVVPEVARDPLSPVTSVVRESTEDGEIDRASVKSDPLLVGGLEEAMSGSVLDLVSAPANVDSAEAQSPLTSTPGVSSPAAPSSPAPQESPVPSTVPANSEFSSGADLLLPLIIYAVVKSCPPQLVSHLLYIQRYRPSFCFSGEASYALVNLTAVVDFLENVNPDSLGLAGEGRLLSADFQSFDEAVSKDLAALSSPQAQAAAQSRLRGRVSQVSDFASSGLNNVAATGFGALRSLIENGQMAAEGFMIQVPGVANPTRPMLLGRKTSGFSIAGIATSVAGIAASAGRREGSITGSSTASPVVGGPGEWGIKREMVDVSSRPGSLYERVESDDDDADDALDSHPSEGEDQAGALRRESDARSIRSTRSVASTRSLGNALKVDGTPIGSPSSERLSISERFARMSTGGTTNGSGAESPAGLGVASSLPKATPFLPTHGTRSASNSVSSLTQSTRRATILGGATFIPPASPTRPASVTTPSDPSPLLSTTPSTPLPTLSQAHLPSSPLSVHSTAHTLPMGDLAAADKRDASPHHIESTSTTDGTVRPPVERFLACADAGELRVVDVGELLRDYQRLAGVLRDIGVWD